MTATLRVTPTTAAPGELVNIDGAGWNPKGVKFALTTTNAAGQEVGQTSNTNRVQRDGSFHVGVFAPPMVGPATVTVYQGATKVSVPITVAGTPPTGTRVTSIAAILAALGDNAVTDIVVANGTYAVPDAATHQSTGLWIDSRFASRTRPVTVRAETVGGVIFSGSGARGWNPLCFRDGAHSQTWQGFRFADGEPTQTGVIVFGQNGSVTPRGVSNIALADITIEETVTSDNPAGMAGDHAVYFSSSTTPNRDITIDGLTVHAATSGLDTALHFYTQPALGPGPQNVTVRNMTVEGTDQAVMFWDASLSGIAIEDSTITGARQFAVRYELGGSVTLRRVTSTGSAVKGFHSSAGPTPPGVTFIETSLA